MPFLSTASSYSTTTSTTMIWDAWNQSFFTNATSSLTTTTAAVMWSTWNNHYASYQETAQQRAARECHQAEQAERWRREDEDRQRARARAEEVLRACLTDEQRRQLDDDRGFHVLGSHGRRWLIKASGQSGNVVLLDDEGRETARFCAHPPGVPDADAWLAQKLAIETDEEAFLDVANCHAPGSGWRPELVARRNRSRNRLMRLVAA